MKIRVIQWNISYSSKIEKIAEYLKSQLVEFTIINLQEINSKKNEKILELIKPDAFAFSLDKRRPGKNESANRSLGVGTYVINGSIESSRLLERTVFPERTLYVESLFNSKIIKTLNFHSLTGSGYKKAKPSNFATIADFLQEENDRIDFFTCDANEPKVDSLFEADLEFWDNLDKGYNASLILGKNRVHGLTDSLREHLILKGQTTTSDPLALSHETKNSKKRYDFIYNSKNWKILNVEYPYKESLEATSDHSMVIGDYLLNV